MIDKEMAEVEKGESKVQVLEGPSEERERQRDGGKAKAFLDGSSDGFEIFERLNKILQTGSGVDSETEQAALLEKIYERCGELRSSSRSSIFSLSDPTLRSLVGEVEKELANKLGISEELVELRFIQTNNGIALRGNIRVDGDLRLPLDISKDGIVTFSKPFGLTQEGLSPQNLGNMRFTDNGISAYLSDGCALQKAFEAVKHVTKETGGREYVLSVITEGVGSFFSLARDQVGGSFYLYKFETTRIDSKEELIVSKQKVSVQILGDGNKVSFKVKNGDREILFPRGVSSVALGSRTSQTAEMLFAEEEKK